MKKGDIEKYRNSPYFEVVTSPSKTSFRIVITEEGLKTVGKLAAMGCSDSEIIAFLGATYSVLHSKYNDEKVREVYERARELSRTRIRQAQYKCLDNGNSAVTIFMSKAVLGMTDGQTAPVRTDMFAEFLDTVKQYAEQDAKDSKEEHDARARGCDSPSILEDRGGQAQGAGGAGTHPQPPHRRPPRPRVQAQDIPLHR